MTSLHYPKLHPHGSIVHSLITKTLVCYDERGDVILKTQVTRSTEQACEARARVIAIQRDAASWAFV